MADGQRSVAYPGLPGIKLAVRIFSVLDSSGMAEALLNSGNFSFDWHSGLILAILRRSSAYPLLKIKQLLFREASL